MKLLRESTELDSTNILIEENEVGLKRYYIGGIFLQSNIKNRNGRLYPKDIMKNEVQRYIKEFVNTNRACGELEHPDSPVVSYKNASHKIISLIEDGDNYIGKALILDTPNGLIVQGLLKDNVQIGVSSRGLGSLSEKNGVKVVCDDFFLVTAADIVSDPSAPDALVSGLMENKEWYWNNGSLIEHESEIKKTINTMSRNNQLNTEGLRQIFDYVLTNIK